jgi:hypothetical protein
MKYVNEFFISLFTILLNYKFTIFPFQNVQCETTHAYDIICNLGSTNTICCTGYIRPCERVGSGTFPTLNILPLISSLVFVVLAFELRAS